jgi:hypothetical protein
VAEREPAGLNRHQNRKDRHGRAPRLPAEDPAAAVPATPEGATFVDDARRRWSTPDDLAASSAACAEVGVENIQSDTDAPRSREPASDAGIAGDS